MQAHYYPHELGTPGSQTHGETVLARDREFMSRDTDPAKAFNAAMNGLASMLEVER